MADNYLINRNGTLGQFDMADTGKLEDTDLLLVNRDGTTYTVTGLEVKESAGPRAAPELQTVTLTQDAVNSNRYTSNSFTTSAVSVPGSEEVQNLGLRAAVTGALTVAAATTEITDYDGETITLFDDSNLGVEFETGDVVKQNASHTPVTSEIATVTDNPAPTGNENLYDGNPDTYMSWGTSSDSYNWSLTQDPGIPHNGTIELYWQLNGTAAYGDSMSIYSGGETYTIPLTNNSSGVGRITGAKSPFTGFAGGGVRTSSASFYAKKLVLDGVEVRANTDLVFDDDSELILFQAGDLIYEENIGKKFNWSDYVKRLVDSSQSFDGTAAQPSGYSQYPSEADGFLWTPPESILWTDKIEVYFNTNLPGHQFYYNTLDQSEAVDITTSGGWTTVATGGGELKFAGVGNSSFTNTSGWALIRIDGNDYIDNRLNLVPNYSNVEVLKVDAASNLLKVTANDNKTFVADETVSTTRPKQGTGEIYDINANTIRLGNITDTCFTANTGNYLVHATPKIITENSLTDTIASTGTFVPAQSLWNQDKQWSNNAFWWGGDDALRPNNQALMFNGNPDNGAYEAGGARWVLDTPLPCSEIEVKFLAREDGYVRIYDGSGNTFETNGTQNGDEIATRTWVPTDGSLGQIWFGGGSGMTAECQIYEVKVDGRTLVDKGISGAPYASDGGSQTLTLSSVDNLLEFSAGDAVNMADVNGDQVNLVAETSTIINVAEDDYYYNWGIQEIYFGGTVTTVGDLDTSNLSLMFNGWFRDSVGTEEEFESFEVIFADPIVVNESFSIWSQENVPLGTNCEIHLTDGSMVIPSEGDTNWKMRAEFTGYVTKVVIRGSSSSGITKCSGLLVDGAYLQDNYSYEIAKTADLITLADSTNLEAYKPGMFIKTDAIYTPIRWQQPASYLQLDNGYDQTGQLYPGTGSDLREYTWDGIRWDRNCRFDDGSGPPDKYFSRKFNAIPISKYDSISAPFIKGSGSGTRGHYIVVRDGIDGEDVRIGDRVSINAGSYLINYTWEPKNLKNSDGSTMTDPRLMEIQIGGSVNIGQGGVNWYTFNAQAKIGRNVYTFTDLAFIDQTGETVRVVGNSLTDNTLPANTIAIVSGNYSTTAEDPGFAFNDSTHWSIAEIGFKDTPTQKGTVNEYTRPFNGDLTSYVKKSGYSEYGYSFDSLPMTKLRIYANYPHEMTVIASGGFELTPPSNTSGTPGWVEVPLPGGAGTLEAIKCTGANAEFYAIEVNDERLVDPFTFAKNKVQFYTDISGEGVVESVDVQNKTIDITGSNDAWLAGYYVQGPLKDAVSMTAYISFDSSGANVDLTGIEQSPILMNDIYTPSITFPGTFSTGEAPDIDLPYPTYIQTFATASNEIGVDPNGERASNILFPETSSTLAVPAMGTATYNVAEFGEFCKWACSADLRAAQKRVADATQTAEQLRAYAAGIAQTYVDNL